MNARLISQAKTIRKLKAESRRLQKQIQKVEAGLEELQERHLALEVQLKEKNYLLASQDQELRELLAELEQLQKEGELSEEQAGWMTQIRNRLLCSTDNM
jgi:peptidoglycan hydrolase CwlO-like protein